MKIHISKYQYKDKVRAKTANQLLIDLMTSTKDISISEFIQEILNFKMFIPAYLNTPFIDTSTYNIINDTYNNLILSEDELNNISINLDKHSQYRYKDIIFTKSFLKLIKPNKPFILNHRFCWTNQQIFIINILNKNLIEKAKQIGLAFWYQPIYPENSYNLIFVTDQLITDYRVAYLINQSLHHYLSNPSTLERSDLSSYYYGTSSQLIHSGYKSINNHLDLNLLLRNIQNDLFKKDSNVILDFVLNFDAKVRLRHCKLKKERVFHMFSANNPSFFNKDIYYTEFDNIGFSFYNKPNESKLNKVVTTNQINNADWVILNFPLEKEQTNIPLKSAQYCCKLLNDFLNSKVSPYEIDLIISNIRYFKFGLREAFSLFPYKEKILYSLSHFNKRLPCKLCKYFNQCTSNTDLFSHLLSLDQNIYSNNDYINDLPLNKLKPIFDTDKHILINNLDPRIIPEYKNNSIRFSSYIPYEGLYLDKDNVKDDNLVKLSLNNELVNIHNQYMPFVTKQLKPDYIYLDDSFLFSNLIKIFKIPDNLSNVKNCLLSNSFLSLSIKDKILNLFNQIESIKKLDIINVKFNQNEINTIISILKENNYHYYWNYLFRSDNTYLFKEFNMYSLSSYDIYYFYFNLDMFDFSAKFIINTTLFNKELWNKIIKDCDYQYNIGSLNNIYIHPKYSFSYSQLKKLKALKYSNELNYIKNFINDKSIIVTHKDCINLFLQEFNRISLTNYFGSPNKVNLNNLVIIGTPRMKEVYYYSLALLMGESINNLNKATFGSFKSVYKGVRFPFRSYSLQILNEIMFSQIESEFRKIISSPCDDVHIFSNFIFPGAKIVW